MLASHNTEIRFGNQVLYPFQSERMSNKIYVIFSHVWYQKLCKDTPVLKLGMFYKISWKVKLGFYDFDGETLVEFLKSWNQ